MSYIDNMSIQHTTMLTKIMKATVGDSENHQVHYNPMTAPKPPEELQRLIYPFIDK